MVSAVCHDELCPRFLRLYQLDPALYVYTVSFLKYTWPVTALIKNFCCGWVYVASVVSRPQTQTVVLVHLSPSRGLMPFSNLIIESHYVSCQFSALPRLNKSKQKGVSRLQLSEISSASPRAWSTSQFIEMTIIILALLYKYSCMSGWNSGKWFKYSSNFKVKVNKTNMKHHWTTFFWKQIICIIFLLSL